MQQLLKNKKIYNSTELQKFILNLEEKYKIKSDMDKYHDLVNFSTNINVPFHQWFNYREGFSSELIKELLKSSGIKKGECVIDPFCGSGTTNIVSLFNDFNTLGLDVNPMSAYIANAKLIHYNENDKNMTLDLLKKLKTSSFLAKHSNYIEIKKYFTEYSYNELVKIKSFIDTLPDSNSKSILLVAFFSIIIDVSERKRDGNGLKKRESKVKNILEFYEKKVSQILNDISIHTPTTHYQGICVSDTAYNLNNIYNKFFPETKVGVIIFSPPYANSFDYFESYKLELIFGGYATTIKDISSLRKNAIRSFIGAEKENNCDFYIDLIAQEIELAIPKKEEHTQKKDFRTRKVPNMIKGYFSDMRKVLHECYKLLPEGRKTYIIVDQSSYCGIIIPTDLLLAYLGECEGFKVNNIIECRKARTSTQQLRNYPYLKNILRESIIELCK